MNEGKTIIVDSRETRRQRMSLGQIEKRGTKAYTTKRFKNRKTKSGKVRRVNKNGRA